VLLNCAVDNCLRRDNPAARIEALKLGEQSRAAQMQRRLHAGDHGTAVR
jgi:hypothetical protein